MKKQIVISVIALFTLCSSYVLSHPGGTVPSGCKPVINGKVVTVLSLDTLLLWCETTPPVVQCDDGKKYNLNSFAVSFFTVKPLMNQEFGIGEGGIPIKAKEAVAKGHANDALVLKEVNATGPKGEKVTFPVISLKIK